MFPSREVAGRDDADSTDFTDYLQIILNKYLHSSCIRLDFELYIFLFLEKYILFLKEKAEGDYRIQASIVS